MEDLCTRLKVNEDDYFIYDNRFATTLGNETKAENVRELKAFKVHTFHSTSTARHHSDNKVKGQLRGRN